MQLAGELTKISLPSLIQLLRNGELTGKICLTQGTHTAFLYVDEGRVIHAESEIAEGLDALLELFLWLNGTFSFIEGPVDAIPQSIPDQEAPEKIIREGLAYLEQQKFLDQLRVTPRSILKPASPSVRTSNPMFAQLDGKTPLAEIGEKLGLSRRDFVFLVFELLEKGNAVVVELPGSNQDQITLPPWVTSRLQQDNPDISQAIVDMVIWVDRIKCWMYQADADMDRIISQLDANEDGAEANGSDAGEGDAEKQESAEDSSLPQSSKRGDRQASVEF